MVRVYSGRVTAIAYIIRSALEGDGISAEIRNELAAQIAGGIPMDQGYVEVWVRKEEEARSLSIVQTILSAEAKGSLSLAEGEFPDEE